MTDYNKNSDVYNSICEAEGCIAKATKEIKVKAGPQKVISLLLCNRCVSKFEAADCPKSNSVLCAPCSLNEEVKENVY